MKDSLRRRLGLYAAIVFVVIVTYSAIYQWAVLTLAGERISFVHSLRVVIEILSTAGFGGDTDAWEHSDVLGFFVLVMNLTGVLLVFIGLPLSAVPLFRRALQTGPPTTTDLTDHVIICSYSERDEVLRNELESVGVPYLYIDEDPELVSELVDDGLDAIHGDPEKVETLRNANIEEARTLVADVDDETNPTVIISANRANPDLRVVSLATDAEAAQYHRYAGADEVVQSRKVLAESLAMHATSSLAEEFREAIKIENGVEIKELLVQEGSDLAGKTLGEVKVFDDKNVTVIGGWFGGKFVVSPEAETVIEDNSILLVVGKEERLNELKARPIAEHGEDESSEVVVCGYGSVGRAVADELRKRGVDVTAVDKQNRRGVDVVGDITEPQTLLEAGVRDARAVVIAIDVDTPAIYSSIVINQVAPDVEIVARAGGAESVWKLYNAGADYVLSLPTVTGELLASILIHEKEILTAQSHFDFRRTEAPALVGKTFADVSLRNETGCTVVAVERDGELITQLGGEFTVQEGDVLVAAGSEESLERLTEFVRRGVLE